MKFLFCNICVLAILIRKKMFLIPFKCQLILFCSCSYLSWEINQTSLYIRGFVVSNLCGVFLIQFLDMSPLDAALPNAQLPSTFHGGVSQPWFPQNTGTPYIPAVGQGTLYQLLVELHIMFDHSFLQKLTLELCLLIAHKFGCGCG